MKNVWWYDIEGRNAGDMYGAWLIKKLGYECTEGSKYPKDFIVCGSIIKMADENSTVIGAGLHCDGEQVRCKNIKWVRGKLTRDKLNLDCGVGDPGILAGRVYTPKTTKKYKYGIISHYVDRNTFTSTPSVPVISMMLDDHTTIEDLLDKINECEFIFSSSLHGIIFAHSLGIPAIHLENKPLYSIDNFKFKDYYSVFSLPYTKEKFQGDYNFVNKYLDHKELYLPDREETKNIQDEYIEMIKREWKF